MAAGGAAGEGAGGLLQMPSSIRKRLYFKTLLLGICLEGPEEPGCGRLQSAGGKFRLVFEVADRARRRK